MNPDELLLNVLKARDNEVIRPIEYWKTHCVNCGQPKHLPDDQVSDGLLGNNSSDKDGLEGIL